MPPSGSTNPGLDALKAFGVSFTEAAENWAAVVVEFGKTMGAHYERCTAAAEWGECVLAAGHETHSTAEVGARPRTAHIDRWGRAWGIASGGQP